MKWRFWEWLFRGLEDRPGYRQFVNVWLIFQVAASIGLAVVVKESMHDAAQTVLLPLIAVFVGLSLAWVGNAQVLLQASEIEQLAEHVPDGLETYLYTFQLSILVILVTVSTWGLAALGVCSVPLFCHDSVQFTIEAVLYLLILLTVRECWHVVMGSQILILARHVIRTTNEEEKDRSQGTKT